MDKLRCAGNNNGSSKGCGGENSSSSSSKQQPLWGQIREDTLLPPSRRNASSNASTPTSFDGGHNKKRNSLSKKWSIDGLFKRVSSLLDHSASVSSVSSAESSSSTTGSGPSSSLEELPLAAVTSNFRGASEYDTGNFPRVTELDAVRATRPIVWISAPDSTTSIIDDATTMSSAGRGHRHQRSSAAALLTEAAPPPPHNCCCSCGSSSPNNVSSGGRRCRAQPTTTTTTKARVESRRSSVIAADCSSSSDMDESGGGGGGNGSGSWRSSSGNNPTNKRRSRASRTERYLKRQCGAVNGLVNNNNNGGGNNDSTSALECHHSGSDSKPRVASRIVASDLDRLRPPGVLEGTPRMLPCRLDGAARPRSEVPEMLSKKYAFRTEQPRHIYALPSTSTTSSKYGQQMRSSGNSASPSSANGANNPLVQQTLQYFSQFNDNDAAVAARIKPVPKPRKLYPQQQQQNRISAPPVPPSRDSSSSRSLLINGLPINRYNDTILQQQQQQQQQSSDKENNSEYSLERHSISSPSCEVRLINEGRLLLASSNNGYGRTIPVARASSSREPLRDSRQLNDSSVTSPARSSGRSSSSGGSSATRSPSLGPAPPPPLPEKPKYLQQSQSQSQRSLPLRRPRSRQDSANLESALEELETIFNSLHLDADEQLLDRAERRTLEEMHYRGLTASPVPYDAEDDPAARRKTWADSNLLQGQDEVDRAAAEHRLRDDMAFRRMQSANRQDSRPASSCAAAGLESISYLMTPVPFGGENSPRRWEDVVGTKQQQQQQQQNVSGRKKRAEPDVTLDDVVFRMRHHANNTLKIADPQPPFGIPLGPIATATESDYLHSQAPSCSPASGGRSPYIPSREPDLVTDDLAYRALRKDASSACSSHHHHNRRPSQSSPMSFCSPVPSTPSPLHFGSGRSIGSFKKRHRSLSSNLYGVISSSQSPTGRGKGYADDDDDDDLDSCRSGSQAAIVSDSESLGFVNDSGSSFRDATSGHVTSEEPCPRVRVVVVDRPSSDLDLSSKSCEVHNSEDDARSKDRSRSREPTHDNSSASFVTCDLASVAGSGAKARRDTSPEGTVAKAEEPDNSAYKKLCQDLENLVQLTKGIDGNVPSSNAAKSVASSNKPAALRAMSASEIIDGIARDDDDKDDKEDVEDKKEEEEEEDKVADGQSTIKREISTVLDDLKNLRETCREDIERCRESELLQPASNNKPIGSGALESSSSIEAAAATTTSSSSREKRENRDNSSKAFMRNVREAKLAGDWKESTPRARNDGQQRSTIVNSDDDDDLDRLHRRGQQRPPLQSRGNDNWEGEHAAEAAVVTCSLLGSVLSRDNQRRGVELFGRATTASARLTAKCIRHITNNSNGNNGNNNNSNSNNNNNLTAQCCCCILLVFFLVLLIAIQYVP